MGAVWPVGFAGGLLLRGNRIDPRSIDATRFGHTPMLDRFRRRAGPAQTRAGTAKDPSTVTGRGLGPSGRLCGRRQSAPASLRGARPARAHTLRAVLVTPADAAGEPCAGCANRRIFRALTKVLGPRGSKWPPGRVGAGARKQAEASPGSFGAALHFRVYRPHRYRSTAPRAESADAFITMGFDEDLDDAVKGALGEMIKLITERTGLSASDVSRIAASQPGPP